MSKKRKENPTIDEKVKEAGVPETPEQKFGDEWDNGYRSPYMTYSRTKRPYLLDIVRDRGRY